MTDVPENNDAHRKVPHLQGSKSYRSMISPAGSPASFSAARRTWLLGSCAAAAALAFAGVSRAPLLTSAFAADAAPAAAGLDAFLALSQHLTGRSEFDPLLGQRVYAALSRADSQFAQNVGALNTWLQSHGGVPSDTVTQALQSEQPALAKTVGAIMRAWYLGLVGDMPHVEVVAYEKALMFTPVSDVLTIPSYCRDVPFYWTRNPASA
ncbi:sorbitol dehydrogenase family protein [Paraburkholderia sp. MMS20-SJTR3]|uniref:Sorbitol dehydrogenase family protein n=1 Tax=Paraburkholderia sejongensis TaxID=2886946 RepID=A0ABS8K3M2_9BURK|nr:sorbitol dehydrogenase family protein [Paraburkholderia sp. MMS20-SJTR3]MCC8396758.1 sorbitol dehydrogenase family protein [Paraburkholderia sp. MMS20-SJTR3]